MWYLEFETCSNESCVCCIADSDARLSSPWQNDTKCVTPHVDMSFDCTVGYTGINSGKEGSRNGFDYTSLQALNIAITRTHVRTNTQSHTHTHTHTNT